jgi:hypothetical protein
MCRAKDAEIRVNVPKERPIALFEPSYGTKGEENAR